MKIPRDRNGEFEPVVVPKYQTVQSDVEQKIIAMYAKGMTTRDIQGYMNDIYGIDVSPTMISSITDKVMPMVKEWQIRPLSDLYTILYLDGVHFKVREDGRIIVRCAYVILGINGQGMKEILGIWIGENEGSKFWMQILNEIKNHSAASAFASRKWMSVNRPAILSQWGDLGSSLPKSLATWSN